MTMDYPGNVTTTFEPGSGMPFSGHGSAYDGQPIVAHWAMVSHGLIQMKVRHRWTQWVRGAGGGPHVSCALCRMLVGDGQVLRVNGRSFHPQCAPKPRRH